MQLEQIRAMNMVQDIDDYQVTVNSDSDDINLDFEMAVDMPYQYWIDIHEFYMGHEQSLREAGGDVIKRVMNLYGQLIIGFLADGKPFSPQMINEMLADYEGLVGEPFITVKILNFDCDIFDDMTTEYRVK